MKTYEARSRIGLKLKIKQEAGLSKVIHNTALDPPGIPPGTGTGTGPGPGAALAAQLNGSLEKKAPTATLPKAGGVGAAPCRLPLRKSYREINREINREQREIGREISREINREINREHRELNRQHREANRELREVNREVNREMPQHRDTPAATAAPRSERRPVITALRRDPGSAGRIRPGKGPPEEPSDGEEEEEEEEDEEEDEEDEEDEEEEEEEGGAAEPPWAGKRRRAEAAEVDAASFSSESPQDDSLSEHLQSAIDSILNLQQPRGAAAPPPAPAPAPGGAGSPFPAPPRRTEPLLPPPSHNGGLGAARTCTR